MALLNFFFMIINKNKTKMNKKKMKEEK